MAIVSSEPVRAESAESPEKLKYRARILPQIASRCLICEAPPCTDACSRGLDPAAMLRSVRFDNIAGAAESFDASLCRDCAGSCETVCPAPCGAIEIRRAASLLGRSERRGRADLSIEFCGVKCENPFFLSSSVVASGYEMCASALRMGWAGIVYKTIGCFVPEEVSPRFDALYGTGDTGSFSGFRNLEQISDHTTDENFEILARLKREFPTKVIVASIMGRNEEEWTYLAKRSEECGADMIECNFSCPHMSVHGLGADVGTDPELVAAYTAAVRRGTGLPVLAKMTPNLSHMELPAVAAVRAGADALAAINTIKSLSGLDLESLEPGLSVSGRSAVSGYSGKAVKPIALRFISDMANCTELSGVPISGMGGVESWRDAAEFIALGCSNVQVTTSVMEYGYRIIDDLIDGLSAYLYEKGMSNVGELVGSALGTICQSDELDRETVEYPKFDRSLCVGCGRCYVSCRDAGHQALGFDRLSRSVKLDPKKCVGCQLCRLVCPAGAITRSKRIPKKKL